MPIKRCTTSDNKSGFKYGDSGHCYSDKKDALKQGRAIEMNKHAKGESADLSILTFEQLLRLGMKK